MPYGQLPGVNTPVANPLMQLLQASATQQGPQMPAGLAQLLGLSQGQSLTDRLKAMGEPAQQEGPNPAAVGNLFKQNQPPVSQTPIQDMLDNILPDLDVPEQTDPNQDMLEMLLSGAAIPSAGGGSADYEQMMQAATKGVAQPFNAQIGLLKHQNKAAKAETAAGRKEIESMYRALSRDQQRVGRREMKRGRALSGELQDIGAQGADLLGQSTEEILNNNAAAAQGLGSSQLLEALNPKIANQGQQIAGRMIGDATAQATGELARADNDRRYYNRSSNSSNLEGVNRSADLLGDLQDYLAGNRAQIGTIAGQKAQALSSAKNSIMGAIAQQQDDSQQQTFDNQMDVIQWWTNLQNDIADREAQNSGGTDYSKLFPESQANAQGLIGQFPELQGLFQEAGSMPEFMQGYFRNEDKQNVPLQGNYFGVQQFLQQALGDEMPTDPVKLQALIAALSQIAPRSQMPSY